MRISKQRVMEIIVEEISRAMRVLKEVEAYPDAMPADVSDDGEAVAAQDAEMIAMKQKKQKASDSDDEVDADEDATNLAMMTRTHDEDAMKHIV